MKRDVIRKPILVLVGFLLLTACRTSWAQMGPPPGTYEITSGETSVTIPFRLMGTYVLLSAKIGGEEVGLVLDTGMPANGVVLHAGPEGDNYGLEFAGKAGVMGADGGRVNADLASGVRIDLPVGGLSLLCQQTLLVTAALGELIGARQIQEHVLRGDAGGCHRRAHVKVVVVV